MATWVEKWQWKLCRMANQYCIYAQWGDSIAHLPAQQGFHRYVPVGFRGRIMNLSLFRATKTEQSIVMVENSVSWKALLNNYRLSDIVLSATPSDSKCLLTKTNRVHWPCLFKSLFTLYIHFHFTFKSVQFMVWGAWPFQICIVAFCICSAPFVAWTLNNGGCIHGKIVV